MFCHHPRGVGRLRRRDEKIGRRKREMSVPWFSGNLSTRPLSPKRASGCHWADQNELVWKCSCPVFFFLTIAIPGVRARPHGPTPRHRVLTSETRASQECNTAPCVFLLVLSPTSFNARFGKRSNSQSRQQSTWSTLFIVSSCCFFVMSRHKSVMFLTAKFLSVSASTSAESRKLQTPLRRHRLGLQSRRAG